MKEYRSAVRSRNLIKKAFVELMAEKDISKITVVDIVNAADISRNTFYAHYCDVYAVLEDFENSLIDKLNAYLDEAIEKKQFFNPMPLLQKFQQFIEKNVDSLRILSRNNNSYTFCTKIQKIAVERILANMGDITLRDRKGFIIFLGCLAGGYVDLVRMFIRGDMNCTLDNITSRINDIFLHGIKLYM